jgi:hypothetical protein
MRMKVMINKNGCYDGYSHGMDGFALIFSKQKNYLGPAGNDKGFGGIYDALVVEIDLQHNSGDLSSNFVRLNRCYGTYCRPNGNMPSVNLPFSYDRCKNMIYDVMLTYSNEILKISINGNLVLEQKENLLEKFKGFSYFGISGSFTGNQRELVLSPESYICTNIVAKAKITSFINDSFVDSESLPKKILAGSTILVQLRLYDYDNQMIPHLFNDKIHDWEIRSSFNCYDATQKWEPNNIINNFHINYTVKVINN